MVEPFAFTPAQLDHITAALTRRKALLAQLFPWPEPNYGIDERWIRFFPYSYKAKPGQTIPVKFRIFNHSKAPYVFQLSINVPPGFKKPVPTASVHVPPHAEQEGYFEISVNQSTPPGTYVLTADVTMKDRKLHRWTEAIIEIE